MELRSVLSVSAAAKALGVSTETVRKLYRKGQLEGYTVGVKILLFQESLAAFQQSQSKCFPKKASFTVEENKPNQENSAASSPRRFRRAKPPWERHRG